MEQSKFLLAVRVAGPLPIFSQNQKGGQIDVGDNRHANADYAIQFFLNDAFQPCDPLINAHPMVRDAELENRQIWTSVNLTFVAVSYRDTPAP